ncbi:MAG: zinc finger domain-containing protein [Gammaproteobacteria bacterium]
MGNIYADEILFRAHVDPRRPAASLTPGELRRVRGTICVILHDAVAHADTTYPAFMQDKRHRHSWLERAQLFGRQGKPCLVCGSVIKRIRVAGRGTNYCPHCQPRNVKGRRADAAVE